MPKFVRQGDNTLIGNNTFTGTNTFSGAVVASGGITGNVTGNLTGNVTGAVNGAASSEVVVTTNVIGATESGKTFFLNHATGFVSTLPAPALGLNFKFIIGGVPPTSGNHTVVTKDSANVIHGIINYAPTDDAGAVDDNADTISFVASQAQEGDWVEVISDGTDWFVRGQAQVAEGITLTTAS